MTSEWNGSESDMATIVVAFDGRRNGRKTLERVAELAGDDDRVVVVGSVDAAWNGDPTAAGSSGGRGAPPGARRGPGILFRLGVGARTMLGRGRESTVLAAVASQSAARLIVVGTPRTLVQRIGLRLGLARLERLAPCPVVRVH